MFGFPQCVFRVYCIVYFCQVVDSIIVYIITGDKPKDLVLTICPHHQVSHLKRLIKRDPLFKNIKRDDMKLSLPQDDLKYLEDTRTLISYNIRNNYDRINLDMPLELCLKMRYSFIVCARCLYVLVPWVKLLNVLFI